MRPQARAPERAIVSADTSRDDERWREEISLKREQLALRRAEMEQERPAKILRVAEQFKVMMEDLDMLGPAEQIALKDVVSNGLSMIGGNVSLTRQLALTNVARLEEDPGETLLTVSEWLALHHNRVVPQKDAVVVGKAVAAAYRLEVTGDPFGDVDPSKKAQSVGGRITMVNAYSNKPVASGKRSGQDIVRNVLAARNMF